MSLNMEKEATKMLAFEKLTELRIANSNDQEFLFWKRVKKEIDLITEGLGK